MLLVVFSVLDPKNYRPPFEIVPMYLVFSGEILCHMKSLLEYELFFIVCFITLKVTHNHCRKFKVKTSNEHFRFLPLHINIKKNFNHSVVFFICLLQLMYHEHFSISINLDLYLHFDSLNSVAITKSARPAPNLCMF